MGSGRTIFYAVNNHLLKFVVFLSSNDCYHIIESFMHTPYEFVKSKSKSKSKSSILTRRI